jgi:hypothetical protein
MNIIVIVIIKFILENLKLQILSPVNCPYTYLHFNLLITDHIRTH